MTWPFAFTFAALFFVTPVDSKFLGQAITLSAFVILVGLGLGDLLGAGVCK